MNLTTSKPRIVIVDILRGVAIMAIMLLHNIEHFNFYNFPEPANDLMRSIDSGIWDTMFFIFAGKAYAIFSLLFGFSFYIQYTNQQNKSYDFRLRFLWRMVLLFCLGCINGAFFPGDILVLYSIISPILIITCRLSNKWLLIIAGGLLLQPMEWYKFFAALGDDNAIQSVAQWKIHMRNYYPVLAKPDFWATIKSNFWDGQWFSILWGYSHGRFFQTAALFLLGMILGRTGKFENLDSQMKFWSKTLLIGVLTFIPLYIFVNTIPELTPNKASQTALNTIFSSFRNFSFTMILVGFIVIVWNHIKRGKLFDTLAIYGKMSLTNYITQSIVGSFVYFEFGLGLWNDLGKTGSFLMGIALLICQIMFCKLWLSHFKQGPFEYIWKKATWIGYRKR